jgi:hypothetical protein
LMTTQKVSRDRREANIQRAALSELNLMSTH